MEDHTPVLRAFLLGTFRLELEWPDGTRRVIEDFEALLGRGQSAILFKLILCQPERRVKQDLLVRAIWPGQTLASIRKSLDVTKSVLGRTLEELCGCPVIPRVSGDPPIYAAPSQAVLWTDLEACEQAHSQALITKDSVAALAHWECMYTFMQRGELLASDTTAYWYQSPLVQKCRTKLIKERMQCVLRIADLALECGDMSRALAVLMQECEADPVNEDLAFHLMNVLARQSRYSEALAQYTQLEAVLQERGAMPREETKRLALWLRTADPMKRFSGWSSVEIGGSGSVRPSSEEKRTDEMGGQAFLLPPVESAHAIDWGEAPQAKVLYGREQELTTLSQWIVNGQAHLVAIIGMAGIGKTSLAVALIEQIHATFRTIVWRSLQNAPPLRTFLQQCIQGVCDQQQMNLPETLDDQISLLLTHLRADRCLLVLDNLESILQSGKRAGDYREGYEGYGRLITRIGASKHQSCLLLTSREKPKEVALLEDSRSPVQSYNLKGLSPDDGMQILRDKGTRGETDAQTALISLYAGNPLALKLVSQYIVEVFQGEVAAFLRDGEIIFCDIQDVLDQQFERLSPLEQDILYWLAIEREAVSPPTLHSNLVHPVPRKEIQEMLRSLGRRHLIEATDRGFILQNVVMEYLTDRLIEQICKEIGTGSLALFNSHALIKAQAKDYVRESQAHRIVQPIGERLLVTFGREGCETILKRILSQSRSSNTQQPSYVAGNLLNLLIQLGCDLHGYDFSYLEIRQAYLQGVTLPEVNFAFAHLANCVFTETFGGILSVAFSPDGRRVAAGTTDGEIRLWNITESVPLLTFQGHTDWVYAVVFSPDGKTIISGSDDQSVRIWDGETGETLKVLSGHTHWILTIVLSPDGKTLVSSGEDRKLLVWDVETGQLLKTLLGHQERVWSVVFSPDGRLIASGSKDKTIHIWNVQTGQILKTFYGHTAEIWSIAFSPDGKTLVSSGEDPYLVLWEIESGRQYQLKSPRTSGQGFWSVAFSPDGKIIGSGSEDGHVYLWEVVSGQLLKVLSEHDGRIRSVTFSPDNRVIMSGGQDPIVRLWDVQTGHLLKTLQGYSNRIWSVAFSPDGKQLASGGEDLTIHLWDVSTGHLLRDMQGHRSRIWSVVFSSTGKMLASSSNDQSVRLWDTTMQKPFRVLREAHRWIYSLAFSPDEKLIVGGSGDQQVYLWECATGRLCRVLLGHTGEIWSVAFSPDGKTLASGSEDKTVRLWETQTGSELKVLQGHTSEVWSVAFSPDGQMLISGGADQCLRLWEVKTGREISVLRGHCGDIRSVAFSPNGQLVVSGSDDLSVRVWDIKTGLVLKCLQEHAGRVRSVAFSSDGETVASGSADGTAKLWDWQKGKCLKTLRCRRPYEQMKITGTTGLTDDQRNIIKALGACE